MKPSILILLIFLFVVSCKKTVDKVSQPKGRITVSEELAAINVFNPNKPEERYNNIDSLVADGIFHLYPDGKGNYYDNGLRLFFKAAFDTSYDTEFNWKIGTENTYRTGKVIQVDFTSPAGQLPVILITRYRSKKNPAEIHYDTVSRMITIDAVPEVFGEYEGRNTDEPANTFKIKVGLMQDPDPRLSGRTYIGVENLPPGFPIRSEIDPASMGWGITGETILQGNFNYQSQHVGSLYAMAFLNARRDSIVIRYNYGIIKDASNTYDWSQVISKVFVGKKL